MLQKPTNKKGFGTHKIACDAQLVGNDNDNMDWHRLIEIRRQLEQRYKELGKRLEVTHKTKRFWNHCYWRIANDNAVKGKWDIVVRRPFYKNATDKQLEDSVANLERMDKFDAVEKLNRRSLEYRNKL